MERYGEIWRDMECGWSVDGVWMECGWSVEDEDEVERIVSQ